MNEERGFHISAVIAENNTCIVDSADAASPSMYGATGLKCVLRGKQGGVIQLYTTAAQLSADL